ncbi:hypothetical protein L873DRAFT_1842764 [Choiromyces venosus 120613-1]|uniref:Uncharacterized protein n=1 Tax=Choiromyces venosus 120613-1 TaxID=1336337 RepID=A0A3N4K4C9_9PEZI|nr:hypothetical protein L873DRAFT_1842764 [Choiromyces venosus 120613-1]
MGLGKMLALENDCTLAEVYQLNLSLKCRNRVHTCDPYDIRTQVKDIEGISLFSPKLWGKIKIYSGHDIIAYKSLIAQKKRIPSDTLCPNPNLVHVITLWSALLLSTSPPSPPISTPTSPTCTPSFYYYPRRNADAAMAPAAQHFENVVAGIAETHRTIRDFLGPEYNQGVSEGRNSFLTQLSDRVDELEGGGDEDEDMSIVRRWIMKRRKEGEEHEQSNKFNQDQVIKEGEFKEDKPVTKEKAAKGEGHENGWSPMGVPTESIRYHNLRKRRRESSEDWEEAEHGRKRVSGL